jgi:hypothetical protein
LRTASRFIPELCRCRVEASGDTDFVRLHFSAALAASLLAGCSQQQQQPVPAERNPVQVRITQFYAAEQSIPKGSQALLCYGVEGASSVRIEPAVEQLSPALTRCFNVSPSETTTYKLIAQGEHGGRDERSTTVTVTGRPAAGPKFDDLVISAKEVPRGQPVSFCFKSGSAAAVKGGPGKWQHGGSASGDCLIDSPQSTTTYSITISGSGGGSKTASMTVQVR